MHGGPQYLLQSLQVPNIQPGLHVLLCPAGSASDAGSDAEELDAETALDLLSLGIVNPVTKESAGAQYQQQLARQVMLHDREGLWACG